MSVKPSFMQKKKKSASLSTARTQRLGTDFVYNLEYAPRKFIKAAHVAVNTTPISL